jgi:solute carrier family 30 (zinc transporter), member 5/7
MRTHSIHSTLFFLLAITAAALTDANFSTVDLYTTLKAYTGLVIHGALQVVSSYTLLHLSNSFETPLVSRALTIIAAATCAIPIHLLGRTIGLLPPYPYVPFLALTPLPLLSFVLLHYHPAVSASSTTYPPQSTFKLFFIPTATFACLLSPLFSRQLSLSDIPLAILFYFVLRPPQSRTITTGTKSASEPILRLLQGYLNAVLSNSESRKIFYFLVINLAYMLVQMLYGVWTNSLGLISDGKSYSSFLFGN